MIHKLFVIIPLPLLLFLASDFLTLDEAEEFASFYYSNIEKTVKTGKEPTSEDEYIKMFGCDPNGNPLYTDAHDYPNYLFWLDQNGEWKQRDTPETIFGDIAEFRHTNNVTVQYSRKNSDYCRPPELRKNEDEPTFAWIHFRTEWTINGKKSVIDDTVYVNLRYKYISRICNKIIPLGESSEETLEDMMAKAAGLYNNKKYKEAATLYSKVLNKYPENADAWYYLGVMYFKGQGIENLLPKQRLQKAYECWKKSDLKKARRAISYITDGRE